MTYPDLCVYLDLFIICLLGIERVQADVVVNEFTTNLYEGSRSVHVLHVERGNKSHLLLKREPLFHRQTVRLGYDRHHVHDLA